MAASTSALWWVSFSFCRYPYRSRKPCRHTSSVIRHYHSHQPCDSSSKSPQRSLKPDISGQHLWKIVGTVNKAYFGMKKHHSSRHNSSHYPQKHLLHEKGRSWGRCRPPCLWCFRRCPSLYWESPIREYWMFIQTGIKEAASKSFEFTTSYLSESTDTTGQILPLQEKVSKDWFLPKYLKNLQK